MRLPMVFSPFDMGRLVRVRRHESGLIAWTGYDENARINRANK